MNHNNNIQYGIPCMYLVSFVFSHSVSCAESWMSVVCVWPCVFGGTVCEYPQRGHLVHIETPPTMCPHEPQVL